jgi:hypothetical protein
MSLFHAVRSTLVVCIALSCAAPFAFCGPPFFTDDPVPVSFRHYEFYLFSTVDRSPDGYGVAIPAFEFNVGAAPNLQLHVVAPLQLVVPTDGRNDYGVGDIEVGAKYRFFDEKGARPQVGVFPMLELPSGNGPRGLGNGTLWAKLPIWIQKSWGPWTSYGGGGYVVNRAPGMRDHTFFGWQVQRELSKKVTLGAEWFNPGRDSLASGNSQIANLGGFYNFNQNFSLLFTAGHTVRGEAHTVAYVGLYWTWGSDRKSGHESSKLNSALFSTGRRDLRN